MGFGSLFLLPPTLLRLLAAPLPQTLAPALPAAPELALSFRRHRRPV
jgi:hypothetical protein